MGFLKFWGALIIFFAVIGFLLGIYYSVILHPNGIIAVLFVIALLGAIYVGYLGPKMEELESRLDSLESKGKPMATSQQALDDFKCATCGVAFASEAQLDEHTIKSHIDFKDSET